VSTRRVVWSFDQSQDPLYRSFRDAHRGLMCVHAFIAVLHICFVP
jgi:hypothetical protein